MRTKENVTGERVQGCEGMAKVSRDAWVRRTAFAAIDEVDVRPEADSADDDDIAQRAYRFAGKVRAKRPDGDGAAARMPGGLVGCEGDTAESHSVAIMEHTVDVRGSEGL
jgi:hypothetical protein